MLKILGMLFILAGTAGLGREYNRYVRQNYQRLVLWREYLIRISSEMLKMRRPLPEIIAGLAKHAKDPFFPFFTRIMEELQKYEWQSMHEIWKLSAEEYQKELGFKGEVMRLFIDCGKILEQENETILANEAELFISQIEFYIQKEQKELADKLKISMYLCMTAGIFLVVLLI